MMIYFPSFEYKEKIPHLGLKYTILKVKISILVAQFMNLTIFATNVIFEGSKCLILKRKEKKKDFFMSMKNAIELYLFTE
jgi:hypothetical protein